MTPSILISPLEPANAGNWLEQAIRIDQLCFGQVDAWQASAFLSERPDKWLLSSGAWHGEELVGYAVAFRWTPKLAHLSRIGVKPTVRGQKIGELLMQQLWQAATMVNCSAITLEFDNTLDVANFYRHCGYHELTPDGVSSYLKRKGKTSKSASYNLKARRVFIRSDKINYMFDP